MRRRSSGLRAGALGTVLAATLLVGCAAQGEAPAGSSAGSSADSGPGNEPAVVPAGSDGPAGPATPGPSLPPGDPGLDAPSVPDPGVPGARGDEHGPATHGSDGHRPDGHGSDGHGSDAPGAQEDGAPHAAVPASALLDAGTVAGVLGGDWQAADDVPAQLTRCVRVPGAAAVGEAGFRASEGAARQLVAPAADTASGDRAVARAAAALEGCGWRYDADPRLGSASAALTSDDGARATVVAGEGVVVVLVGAGSAVSRAAAWASLVDLAFGSACPAAPEGCH